MAWWLTVYCRKSVKSLTAAKLRAGINDEDPSASAGIDYFTLAENYRVPERQVAPALKALKIEPVPGGFELHYRPSKKGGPPHPIRIEVWREKARVAEELNSFSVIVDHWKRTKWLAMRRGQR